MSAMNDLDQAIQAAGGVSALARTIGVKTPHSISMWKKRGAVPHAWSLVLGEFLKKQARKRKPTKEVA
jgi:hypothetical protein